MMALSVGLRRQLPQRGEPKGGVALRRGMGEKWRAAGGTGRAHYQFIIHHSSFIIKESPRSQFRIKKSRAYRRKQCARENVWLGFQEHGLLSASDQPKKPEVAAATM